MTAAMTPTMTLAFRVAVAHAAWASALRGAGKLGGARPCAAPRHRMIVSLVHREWPARAVEGFPEEAGPLGRGAGQGGGEGKGGRGSRAKRRRAGKGKPPDLVPFGEGPFDYHQELELVIQNVTNLGDGIGRVPLPADTADTADTTDSTGRTGSADVELVEDVHAAAVDGASKARSGFVVMVPGVLPGERVRVRVWQNRKSHALADLVEVLEPSPKRIEPRCPYFGECGGCQYQYVSVDEQRRWKRQHVVDVLERIGGLVCAGEGTVGDTNTSSHGGEGCGGEAGHGGAGTGHGVLHVEPVVGSEEVYGYRSKLTPHYDAPERDGTIRAIGFQRRGPSGGAGRLVDVEQCLIATDAINERLATLRREVKQRVRRQATGAASALVEADEGPAGEAGAMDEADIAKAGPNLDLSGRTKSQKKGGKMKGATLLLRDARDGVVTDPNQEVAEEVGGFTFTFKAGQFFQNNPFVLPKMVRHVVSEATRDPKITRLIDAYCGGGLFCISASPHFERCAGVEISELNIQAARRIARANKVTNCHFIAGTAEDIFGAVTFDPSETVLIIDPPRKGCSPEFLAQLVAFRPKRLVYVSCDPATQARDVGILVGERYAIERVTPFDLFPQTRHIENVITMTDAGADG